MSVVELDEVRQGLLLSIGLVLLSLVASFIYFFSILLPVPPSSSSSTSTDAQDAASQSIAFTTNASTLSHPSFPAASFSTDPRLSGSKAWHLVGRRGAGDDGGMATFPHSVLGLGLRIFSLATTVLLAHWLSSFMFFALEFHLIVSTLFLFFAIDFALTIWFFRLVLVSGATIQSDENDNNNDNNNNINIKNSGGSTTTTTREQWRILRMDAFFLAAVGICSFLNCGHFGLIALRSFGPRHPFVDSATAGRVSLIASVFSVPLSLIKGSLITGTAFVLFFKLTQWNCPLLVGLGGGVTCLLSGLLELAVLLRLFLQPPPLSSRQTAAAEAVGASHRHVNIDGQHDQPQVATAWSLSFAPQTRMSPAEVIFITVFFTTGFLFMALEVTHLHLPSLLVAFLACIASFLLWFTSLLPGLSTQRYARAPRLLLALVTEGWYYVMVCCLILAIGACHLESQSPWRYLLFAISAILLMTSAASFQSLSRSSSISSGGGGSGGLGINGSGPFVFTGDTAAASGVVVGGGGRVRLPHDLKEVWRPTLLCLFVVVFVWLLPLYLADPRLTWTFVRDMAIGISAVSLFWLGVAAYHHLPPLRTAKQPAVPALGHHPKAPIATFV